MSDKCICTNNECLRGDLEIGKTYIYCKDEQNTLYPYYIYDGKIHWYHGVAQLEEKHTASVSEKYFNEHFEDIKKNRKDKIKHINENRG